MFLRWRGLLGHRRRNGLVFFGCGPLASGRRPLGRRQFVIGGHASSGSVVLRLRLGITPRFNIPGAPRSRGRGGLSDGTFRNRYYRFAAG